MGEVYLAGDNRLNRKVALKILPQQVVLKRGVTKEFAQENFEKETSHDYPLTTEEMLRLGRDAGFPSVENVWTHDTFAIFFLRKLAADPLTNQS